MKIKLKWLEEIINGLSDKMKKTIVASVVALLIGGGGGGSYLVFAKNSELKALDNEFKTFVADYNLDKKMKRIHWLEEQIVIYEDRYGEKLKRANLEQKKRYKRWKIELKKLWSEVESKG